MQCCMKHLVILGRVITALDCTNSTWGRDYYINFLRSIVFPIFSTGKTHVNYRISRSYLTGVTKVDLLRHTTDINSDLRASDLLISFIKFQVICNPQPWSFENQFLFRFISLELDLIKLFVHFMQLQKRFVITIHWKITVENHLGLFLLSSRRTYRKISWSLEAARFGFRLFQSLWYLSGTSAHVLLRCLSNVRVIRLS